jgi:hypothetical protein
MRARFRPALVAALVAGFAPARGDSADEKSLELKPAWKKGDVARYEMTRTQVRESDGRVDRKVVTRTPVDVEVVESGGDRIVLRWSQGSTVFDDPKRDDDPSARAVNGILKGMDIDLVLDPGGRFTGVRDWKELRGGGVKTRDAVLAQMAKSGTAKATLDLLRNDTDKLFATKESIEAAFARQPALLVNPFGREYEVGKAVEFETELPNVLGGDEPFPATGTYTLKALAKETNVAAIVFKLAADPKEITRVLRKWLDETAKTTGVPAPKDVPELTLEEVTEYQFDLTAGWVASVTRTRTARQPTFTQTDVLTLTRKAR